MKHLIFATFVWLAVPGFANGYLTPDEVPFAARITGAQVVVLGEVHDNPDHHDRQAVLVEMVNPAAVVFEMLTADQAARITRQNRNSESTLGQVLQWDRTGWPDFSMYYPIFKAAPEARIYGAGLPREAAQEALKDGVAGYFGDRAASFGLQLPLDADERAARLKMQRAAHCDALPDVMLPMMIDLQRLRDAMLARTVVAALEDTGGPVVVITGNGHARKDWGMAVYLHRALPDLEVFSLGQSEGGQIDGVFDWVLDYPVIERPDPCLAFEAKD